MVLKWKHVLVAQSCLTLCDPKDYSPPGSSFHGILQARILAGIAILFSRGSSWPKDWSWFSCFAGSFFTIWATKEAPCMVIVFWFHVFTCSCPVSPAPHIKETVFLSIFLSCLFCHRLGDHFYLVPLIYISAFVLVLYYLYYWSFIVYSEVK